MCLNIDKNNKNNSDTSWKNVVAHKENGVKTTTIRLATCVNLRSQVKMGGSGWLPFSGCCGWGAVFCQPGRQRDRQTDGRTDGYRDRPGGKLWQAADKYLMPVELGTRCSVCLDPLDSVSVGQVQSGAVGG